MLGKNDNRRRKRQQRITQLGGITYSEDMSLNKLWEIVEDRGAWHCKELDMTQQLNNNNYMGFCFCLYGICVYVCMGICVYVYISVCVYVYLGVCIYVYLSITLLACEMSTIVRQFEHSLALPFFGIVFFSLSKVKFCSI